VEPTADSARLSPAATITLPQLPGVGLAAAAALPGKLAATAEGPEPATQVRGRELRLRHPAEGCRGPAGGAALRAPRGPAAGGR